MKKTFFAGMMMLGATLFGFDADFTTGKLPKELTQAGDPVGVWKCENNVVRNVNQKPGMPALQYTFPEPAPGFTLSLRMKRAEKKLSGDQHFGFLFTGKDAGTMLYCRDRQFILWNQKKNVHAAIGRAFRAPGEDHWLLLELTVKGTHLEIKADGAVIAESNDFCADVKNFRVYAYNNCIEIGEFKVDATK